MSATFILSLDCEGKWGVADHLTDRHRRDLSDDRLRDAYRSIVQLLDNYRIEATFAFVGLLAQSRGDFARLRPLIEQSARIFPTYLGPALADLDETAGDGWHGDHLLGLVTSSPTSHEIALHGATHVPWTTMDRTGAETELGLFEELAGPVRDSRTFVFPRNLVAHRDLLVDRDFDGFRTARPLRSRAASLLSEFNVFAAPERPGRDGALIEIPAGFFLNWRSGARGLVPPSITRLRARRLIRKAAEVDGIVHYWLHPENIASAPSTLELLEMLLREVADAREAGNCQVLTQLGYCRSRESLR